jgi:hypothetical protein
MKYAAIITNQIHHDGDERSRTNPGHGYPAWTEDVQSIKFFESEDGMLEWVRTESTHAWSRTPYKLIEYQEIQTETTITVRRK